MDNTETSQQAARGTIALKTPTDLGPKDAAATGAWDRTKDDKAITSGRFDIARVAATLPATSDTLLVDHYLTNRAEASARVFRVYKSTPPHYHATCDEYLYVFSGRGTFWMGDPSTQAEFGPGQLLFFQKGTVHAMPDILEEPVVFLSVDTPRRDPRDIIFVNPADGTPESFIRAYG